MTIGDTDYHFLKNSLNLQKRLVQDRIEQMQLVESAIEDTVNALEQERQVDWSQMLELIHLTGMEKSLKTQYQSATNISARIRLHRDYSSNAYGWFPWVYDQCRIRDGLQVLELGCGDGTLWKENISRLPAQIHILLSDISEGMLRDARRSLSQEDPRFSFQVFGCEKIPCADRSFDRVIANHVLFYCEDLPAVFSEVRRVLGEDGLFLCSTYGSRHMQEISDLVRRFDSRIVLSAEKLYDRFGLENGRELLSPYFSDVQLLRYEDSIELDRAEPLIEYILSCHGNQNQYLLDRYKDFRVFVEKQTAGGFHITKDAGVFLCRV